MTAIATFLLLQEQRGSTAEAPVRQTLDRMESSFHLANGSRRSAGMFSASPYSAVEIVLIVAVAGSLSLITVIGNILVMLSIKVWVRPH